MRGRDVDEPTVGLRREWVCFSPNWHWVQEDIAPTVRSSRTTAQDLAEAGPLAGQRDAQIIAMELRDAASHRRTKQAPKEGGSVSARPLPRRANPALLQHTRREEEHGEPGRRSNHAIRRLNAVRLHPHHLVCRLDRLPGRALPVRTAHHDRVARSHRAVDLCDDQPEPGRGEAPSWPTTSGRQSRRSSRTRSCARLLHAMSAGQWTV